MRARRLVATFSAVLAGLVLTPARAGAAAAPLPTHVNSCWSDDNGPVVLDSVTFSPAAVDVTDAPATVSVVVHAHDTGGPGPATGIARMTLDSLNLPDVVMHKSAGAWKATMTIPRGWPDASEAGDLRVDLRVVDRGGRTNFLNLDGPGGYAVAVTDSAPDHTAPVLEALQLSAHHVDSRKRSRSVGVVAKVVDQGSGTTSVVIAAGRLSTALSRVPGTARFRGSLRVPRWQGDHVSRLGAQVTDQLGNTRSWSPSELQAAGFDSKLRISSGPRDRQKPRLVRVVRLTRHVDVRHRSASVRVQVRLADNRGVSSASASLGPFGTKVAPLRRVSGSPRAGLWQAKLRVSRCGHPGGGTGQLRLTVNDASHNWARFGTGPVHVRARDRQGFVAKSRPASGDDLRFTFDEPVHGISTSSVVVGSDVEEDPISGTWTCQDAAGGTTSCLTGAVRAATFAPDSTTPSPFEVDFEPPHHLEVLDRSGNPAFDPIVDIDD